MTERAIVPADDETADAAAAATVYLLDVGPQQYGDALLCLFKEHTILIDGAHPGNTEEKEGHPSIQAQLADLLNQPEDELHVSLLMISHAHDDHIGVLPKLVSDGGLTADWALLPDPDLGWGRTDDADSHLDAGLDARSRQLVNALREEPRSPTLTDAELTEFLTDADLEEPYRQMLKTLKNKGCKVRRFGRDNHSDLVQNFANIGLEILGPRKKHLAECGANVVKGRNDAIGFVADRLRGDDAASPVEAYRSIMQQEIDALDVQRYGHFVNLQSIVACFKIGAKRFFFAGDMQFTDTQTANEIINDEVERMKGEIAARAPYAFFKLCHHGSGNGFDSTMLAGLGTTRYIGICAGSRSESHPSATILKLLNNNKGKLTWARTDHNGQCRFRYTATKTTVTQERGDLNDPVPNKKSDESLPPAPAPPPEPPAPVHEPPRTVVERTADDRTVEVIARIPHTPTRVTITVDVEPRSSSDRATLPPAPEPLPERPVPPIDVSPNVRDLLVVTNRDLLAGNVGRDFADAAITALRARGATVLDNLPPNVDAKTTARPVQAEIGRKRYKGVVILGGYDVVPSQSLDALPPALRQRVGSTGDPDNFIVWNDEVYGDVDNDLLPELPVSRIPDGHSRPVVIGALSARGAQPSASFGLRNVARPFADSVYGHISRNGPMMQSQPKEYVPSFKVSGEHVYIMLHGDYSDGSRFWGEETPNDLEAMNLTNIPERAQAVIFTGCCWGALTVDRPAGRLNRGQTLVPKQPENSIALTFLKNGAQAFVGCTGAHYSPQEPPYQYFGAPMHHAFWKNIVDGLAPAAALFEAKKQYKTGMPHGQTTPSSQAIECKIWRQYTCLGLGW